MTQHPPALLKRQALYWLEHLVDHYGDSEALRLLWWQASISSGGINEGLARPAQWKAQA